MIVEKTMNQNQGHWILAKLGKRVLRPGGIELTRKMINRLGINELDDVVEFAPGLGYTAKIAIARNPRSYTAVEINEEAARRVRKNVRHSSFRVIVSSAEKTSLPAQCASKIWGEAMLTMLPIEQRKSVIAEAARLLRPGGVYAIHEVGIQPETLEVDEKAKIRRDLSEAIQVNVRPLTQTEWSKLLEGEGFEIVEVFQSPMHLLETKRLFRDEGVLGVMRIVIRMGIDAKSRKRVLAMRRAFRKHDAHINAIVIIARKR